MKRAATLFCFALFLCGVSLSQTPTPTGDQTIGTLLASDASVHGSVVLASGGTSLESGSAVDTAGSGATIALKRGGALRVCPASSVTVSQTQSGNANGGLMISLSAGSMEAEYGVRTNADAIITPDFRIVLAGPANFHVALGSNSHGDACVRPLAENSGAILVSELIGGGSYQVKPAESVVFPGGKVGNAIPATEDCGCPASREPVQQVASQPSAPARFAEVKPTPAQPVAPLIAAVNESAPVPPPAARQVQVQVDAPFVFSAVSPEPPMAQVAMLRFEKIPMVPLPVVEAPPAEPAPAPALVKPAKRGIFGHIGSFFSSLFHRKLPPDHSS